MGLSFLKRVPLQHYPWFLNLQFINLLLPLISYPYLLRVIGPEKYGLIAVANSLGAVVLTISEYGYTFIGIKDVARLSGNSTALSHYFSNAMTIRGGLFLLCGIIFIPVSVVTPLLYQEYTLAALTMFGLLPGFLYPHWLFIGLQKVRNLNYIILFVRIISVVLVFIVITDASDYELYPLINIISGFLGAVISYGYLRSMGIQIQFKSIKSLLVPLKEGFYPFISQSLTSLYVNINPILLMALLQDSVLVGYYAVGERIVVLARSVISPLNQLFLPYISKKFLESPSVALRDLRTYAKFIAVISFVAILFLIAFSNLIIKLIAGIDFMPASSAIMFLSPIILIISLNHLAGVQALLNLGLQKEFFYGIFIGGVVHILITVTGVPYLSYNATAVGWVVSEMLILLIFVYHIKKWEYHNG